MEDMYVFYIYVASLSLLLSSLLSVLLLLRSRGAPKPVRLGHVDARGLWPLAGLRGADPMMRTPSYKYEADTVVYKDIGERYSDIV